jgi:2-methylisocitrate lyase-like PEP mutase family enzyme
MVINNRTDSYFTGGSGDEVFADAVERANLFRQAGADCLFIPGTPPIIRQLVAEIDGPLLIGLRDIPMSQRLPGST